MSKRKLYPDECPVFEVVGGCDIKATLERWHSIEHGTVVEGVGWDKYYDGDLSIRCRPIVGWDKVFGQWIRPIDLCPLTPAAVEMWEHVAGRKWKP